MPTINMGTANRQWSSRPMDERFLSLTEMADTLGAQREITRAKVLPSRALHLRSDKDDPVNGLYIEGQNGRPAEMTHWSFGQICGLAKAPVSFMRELPAFQAADILELRLQVARQSEEIGVLVTRDPSAEIGELRAATGPNYGRIWNVDIVQALRSRLGDGTQVGGFKVPGEFGKHVPITRENTTLYASDRDLFVFLADEENKIEVKNRRDGKPGLMSRGIIVANSEVGAGSLVMGSFLFDYVCMNRNIWGFSDLNEIRIRHTAGAPMRWIDDVMPQIESYAKASVGPIEAAIKAAQDKKIDDLDKFLAKRVDTRPLIEAIKAKALEEEGRPIETVFDAMSATTALAKSKTHQDDRVALERLGGSFMQYAL